MNSFLDQIQIEEFERNGMHIVSDEELKAMNEDNDFDVDELHTHVLTEVHHDFWSDFSQINEDDIPF